MKRSSRSIAAEAAWHARLDELGAKDGDEPWAGTGAHRLCWCPLGHECHPRPDCVQAGQGVCRVCAGNDPTAAKAAWLVVLGELGAKDGGEPWAGTDAPRLCWCPLGHECHPRPHNVQKGRGICRVCAGNDPATAKAAWLDRLDDLGAKDGAEPWAGTKTPRLCWCAEGHECHPLPGDVQQGGGICRVCAGRDPATAKSSWHASLDELGGTDGGGPWEGVNNPRLCWCPLGHECHPRPSSVQQGRGICPACAGNDPATAKAAWLDRLDDLGAKDGGEPWAGSNTPRLCWCPLGHECRTRPAGVQRGRGVCRVCAGSDPAASKAAWLASLNELGAKDGDEPWAGVMAPRLCWCPLGHECHPRPNCVQQGGGICRVCAGNDPATAKAAWLDRLAEFGAMDGDEPWAGVHAPRLCWCAEGHECRPWPNSVRDGQGICATCAGRTSDVIYIVVDEDAARCKIGISSGDARPRLGDHRADGYDTVVRCDPLRGARIAEAAVLAALALTFHTPIRGREYFAIGALPIMIAVVDSYLAGRGLFDTRPLTAAPALAMAA
jgi:hypothetical protein